MIFIAVDLNEIQASEFSLNLNLDKDSSEITTDISIPISIIIS
jgi:hypothetical protein